jgi:hypothetical protein
LCGIANNSHFAYMRGLGLLGRAAADAMQRAAQDELARAIVSALRLKLTGGGDSLFANRPTADLAAYDSYLKGATPGINARHRRYTRPRTISNRR